MSRKISIKNDCVTGSEFEDVNMSETTFTNINLKGARFTDINLSESKFHDINFSDVRFTAAQMGGTTFKHIGPPPDKDGKQERQRALTFEEGMLCDSVFRQMDMSNVKLIDCNIDGMTINGILLTDLLDAWKKGI